MGNQEQVDNQNKDNTTASNGGGNVTVSGDITGSAGIIIGQNITTGDIIVELDQSIKQNPNNEYLQGLKKLTEQLDGEYEKYNVPEEKKTEINKSIQDLQTEVKDLKPEKKVESLNPPKQEQIQKKAKTLIEKIVDALPATSETIANLTPLSPFSKFIKGGVQNLVDAYKKYKEAQS
jgi:DNA repair exonuclease SbcCD ATPase subunit